MSGTVAAAGWHSWGAGWRLFLLALAVRVAYDLVLFALMGADGLTGNDSIGYLNTGRDVAAAFRDGTAWQDWRWLGRDLGLMPFYPLYLAANALLFGDAVLPVVLGQAPMDAVTCVLIARIAATIKAEAAPFAGLAAALNPTQIVLAGLVYTDTPFILFCAAGLLAMLRWTLAPSLADALRMGTFWGLALTVRGALMPWVVAAVPFALLLRLLWRRDVAPGGWRVLLHWPLVACLAIAFLGPVLARNLERYDALSFTPQTGAHLLFWVVPLVKEAQDGTPRAATVDRLQAWAAAQRQSEAAQSAAQRNPFPDSARLQAKAAEELRKLGPLPVLKAWALGAAINLGSPVTSIVPYFANLPRTGFYDTPGASKTEKILNFLFRNDQPLYGWALLIGVLGLAAFRLVQLIGLFSGAAAGPEARLLLLILLAWMAAHLLIAGPVASPKYRLPLELVLPVLTGLGLAALRSRFRRRRAWWPEDD